MAEFFYILYKYLDSLKWVMVISGLAYYFRNELKERLKNGFSLNYGSTGINFPQNNQHITIAEEKNNKDIEETIENKTKEEIQKLLNDNQDKDNQIFKFKLEKNFEYTYRIIFKSQIILLNSLQTITDGFSRLQIDNYLASIKRLFPVLASSATDQYLKFLFDQNLIEKDLITGKIKLTAVGNLFLMYMVVNQYNYEAEKSL